MNIEEKINNLKKYIIFSEKECNFPSIFDWNWHMELANDIETLLTAYEKEKEANKKLDKEAQGYLEELAGDGSMNIRRIQELEAELEKEKEKNKELENADLTSVWLDGVEAGKKYFKDKIKAKIEEVKDGTFDAEIVLQSLLEKE